MAMGTDWTRTEIAELFDLPFPDMVTRAHDVHVRFHPENEQRPRVQDHEAIMGIA